MMVILSTTMAQHQTDANTSSSITNFTNGSAAQNRPMMLRSALECVTVISTEFIYLPFVFTLTTIVLAPTSWCLYLVKVTKPENLVLIAAGNLHIFGGFPFLNSTSPISTKSRARIWPFSRFIIFCFKRRKKTTNISRR